MKALIFDHAGFSHKAYLSLDIQPIVSGHEWREDDEFLCSREQLWRLLGKVVYHFKSGRPNIDNMAAFVARLS